MNIGSVVWYTDSLWDDPVQVKVTGIEIGFNGKIMWVKALTGDGEEISDYSNLFSADRPVVYR